jgi:hypothetical protein
LWGIPYGQGQCPSNVLDRIGIQKRAAIDLAELGWIDWRTEGNEIEAECFDATSEGRGRAELDGVSTTAEFSAQGK